MKPTQLEAVGFSVVFIIRSTVVCIIDVRIHVSLNRTIKQLVFVECLCIFWKEEQVLLCSYGSLKWLMDKVVTIHEWPKKWWIYV